MDKKYKTILIDPPWEQKMMDGFDLRMGGRYELPYKTMTFKEICSLPIKNLIDTGGHVWLWTSNQYLHRSFHLLDAWGITYLNTITWVKKSGIGAWFVNTTQHLLMGYNERCEFKKRFSPTHVITKPPGKHSSKPDVFYPFIEEISDAPRLEMFARYRREGWDCRGDQVPKWTQTILKQSSLRSPKQSDI